MISKETYVGKIIEINAGEDRVNEVEVDCYLGDEGWSAIRVPMNIFKGRVEIELENYAAFEIRQYEGFTITEGRQPTPKEEQYLKQREAEHEAQMQKKLDDEIFTPIEDLGA